MTSPTSDISKYRPAVGVAVFNKEGKVWLGKRLGQNDPYCWQMPQGGMDKGEIPEVSAARELWEETGISLDMVIPISEITPWLFYDFPPEYEGRKATKNWRGQRQRWFAFRFNGDETKIDLRAHGPQEFSEWRWGELSQTPELIVPFKRKVYERLASEFERFSKAVN